MCLGQRLPNNPKYTADPTVIGREAMRGDYRVCILRQRGQGVPVRAQEGGRDRVSENLAAGERPIAMQRSYVTGKRMESSRELPRWMVPDARAGCR